MEIGIDSFVAAVPDTLTGENLGPADRLSHLLEEIESADRVGLDVFGIGEHHRAGFLILRRKRSWLRQHLGLDAIGAFLAERLQAHASP
jgi:hypothetical protein